MTFDFQSLLHAIVRSLKEPAEEAREVMNIAVDRRALWTVFALVAVLNALLQGMLELAVPTPAQDQSVMPLPLVFAALMVGFLALNTYLTYAVGKMWGGQGDFQATLTLMAWFQIISLSVTVGQFVLMLISPLLGILFGLASFVALLRCMVNFVDVLHGFDHQGKAFATALIALVCSVIAGVAVLAILGVEIPGGTI